MACNLLSSSAVRVHVSHAYRNIDTTSDHISLILDRRVMFLSFHIGFSLVIAAVVWAILEMISGLDPLSVITEPRYLNLDTVSNLCPFTVIFLLMPLVLLVISLVFSPPISIPQDADVLSRRLTGSAPVHPCITHIIIRRKRKLLLRLAAKNAL